MMGSAGRFLQARPGGDLGGVVVLVATLAVVVAASAVEPRWILGIGDALRRIGGIWRVLVLPVPMIALFVVLAANARATGATWAWVRSRPHRWWRGAAFASASLVSLVGVGLQVGITLTQIQRPIVLWILQLVLHPDTPTAILVVSSLIAVVEADRRGFVVLPWLVGAIADWVRRAWGWLSPKLPLGAAMVGSGIVAAALYPDAMQGWFRPDPPDAQAYNLYSSFFNYSISKDKIVEFEGYELGEAGLVLAPGRTGVLTFNLARPGGSLVLLRPNFYHKTFSNKKEPLEYFEEKTFKNRIEVSTDGRRSFIAVSEDRSFGQVLGDTDLDLTPALADARAYHVRFWSENSTTAPVLVLPIITVSVVVEPLAYPSPHFPVVTYATLTGAIIFLLLKRAADGKLRWVGDVSTASLVVASVATLGLASLLVMYLTGSAGITSRDAVEAHGYALAPWRYITSAGVLLWLVANLVRASRFHAATSAAVIVPVITLVGAYALERRWEYLYPRRFDFLFPDAQGYLQIARTFTEKMQNRGASQSLSVFSDLYQAGFDGKASYWSVFYFGNHNGREPLWSAVIDTVGTVLGFSAFHTRLTSLVMGALVAVVCVVLGARVVHPAVGVFAGLIVAANGAHVVNSVQGLREELVTVLVFVAICTLWAAPGSVVRDVGRSSGWRIRGLEGWATRWPIAGVSIPGWRVMAAALTCAGIILTRADMVVMVALILATLAIGFQWGWRTWLPMGLGIFVLVAPMYVGYWFTHGDPFWPGTYGATVNRNLEFPERMGTPGFPSAAEYAANWAAGPLISPFTYFFGYHTVAQFLSYSVAGFERIFREILFPDQPVILASFWVGLALMIATRQWLVPWGIAVGLLPFYAFMAGVPSAWVFPGRYAHQVLPFAAMAVAYAWMAPALAAWRWYGGRIAVHHRAPAPGGGVAFAKG